MNEETANLLRELAQKLGTTSEHLFAVMVKQAPISSMVDLVVFPFISIVAGVIIYYGLKYGIKLVDDCHGGGPVLVAISVLTAIFFAVYLLCFFTSLSVIIAGFVNPEYWAIKQILGALK